ncbi:hypothetical protein ACLB2K_043277 [Fragaria x ananassa]
MESIRIPALPLPASPSSIPVLGFGTAVYPFPTSDQIRSKEAILSAIKVGYRHFDTAAAYQTEQALGEAIGEAISLGLIKSRDELFVTSKLWCCDAHPHRVLPAIQNTLKNLGLEYLNLYLIHWPVRVVHFQGRFAEFFGKFSLQVVPLGLTSDFRVKFGAGLDRNSALMLYVVESNMDSDYLSFAASRAPTI